MSRFFVILILTSSLEVPGLSSDSSKDKFVLFFRSNATWLLLTHECILIIPELMVVTLLSKHYKSDGKHVPTIVVHFGSQQKKVNCAENEDFDKNWFWLNLRSYLCSWFTLTNRFLSRPNKKAIINGNMINYIDKIFIVNAMWQIYRASLEIKK